MSSKSSKSGRSPWIDSGDGAADLLTARFTVVAVGRSMIYTTLRFKENSHLTLRQLILVSSRVISPLVTGRSFNKSKRSNDVFVILGEGRVPVG